MVSATQQRRPRGAILFNNSTSVPLAGGATYTGEWTDIGRYDSVTASCLADQECTLQLQFSSDGVNVHSTLSYPVAANSNAPHRLTVLRQFFRARVVNGATAQSSLSLECQVGRKQLVSSPLNSVIPRAADAIIARTLDAAITSAVGLMAGVIHDTKYGSNPDVDAAEDIIFGGGDYAGHPQSGGTSLGTEENFQLVCGSADDTSDGTGAREVTFEYLDDDGVRRVHVVATNGGSVDTGISGIRSPRGRVTATGAGGVNAGSLTLQHITTTSNVFWTIPAGGMRTRYAVKTVPAGSVGLIENIMITADRAGGTVTIKGALHVRYEGNEGYTPLFTMQAVDNANPTPNPGFVVLPALTDLKLRVDSTSASNAIVDGQFDYWFFQL